MGSEMCIRDRYFDSISKEEAETMIATIEKFYQIMSGRRATYDKR